MFKIVNKLIRRLLNKIKRVQRFANQTHRYDFPSENNGWRKSSNKQVYGNRQTHSVFDPFAFVHGSDIYMLVSERKENGIDLLKSMDGYSWHFVRKILNNVPHSWQKLVNRSSIVFHNGVWHLWYTGQSPEVSCIAHATSKSILHFENSNIPCIKADLPQEGESVMNPCVLWNNEKMCFQMWYAAGETYEPDAIFYAESQDGDLWIKREEPVLTKYADHKWECAKVGGCDVKLQADGTYCMYYIGYQNEDVARICYATSSDGIHWERPNDNLLLSPTRNHFDSDATYKPSVIEFKGKLYMWYNGRRGDEEYIGLATKEL